MSGDSSEVLAKITSDRREQAHPRNPGTKVSFDFWSSHRSRFVTMATVKHQKKKAEVKNVHFLAG